VTWGEVESHWWQAPQKRSRDPRVRELPCAISRLHESCFSSGASWCSVNPQLKQPNQRHMQSTYNSSTEEAEVKGSRVSG
jgi:hypothetical protein